MSRARLAIMSRPLKQLEGIRTGFQAHKLQYK